MTLYQAGARPAPTDHPTDGRWWETPYGRWRLAGEREAMKRFPDFRLRLTEDGTLAWSGVLRSTFNRRRRWVIKVVYPPHFPWEPPTVTIEKPELSDGSPHLLSGNRPCLYRQAQGSQYGYDPSRTTAATLVAWTALWIHAHEVWRATGRWPGNEE